MSAVPQTVTIGEQVLIRFLGWPATVKGFDFETKKEVDVPHPKLGQPLRFTWNSRPFVIYEGQEQHIPFELAKKEFGDPRSLEGIYRIKDEYGEEQIIPDRLAEVRRLQNYWQDSIVRFREYVPGDRSFAADGISSLLPKVEIYSLTGERIMMVTDDPYGDTVMVENRSKSEVSQKDAIMLQQSDAINTLRKDLDAALAKLNLRREDLHTPDDPKPAPIQAGGLEPPLEATVDDLPDQPRMVFNPKTKRVEPTRQPPPQADPTSIMDLPVDLD